MIQKSNKRKEKDPVDVIQKQKGTFGPLGHFWPRPLPYPNKHAFRLYSHIFSFTYYNATITSNWLLLLISTFYRQGLNSDNLVRILREFNTFIPIGIL